MGGGGGGTRETKKILLARSNQPLPTLFTEFQSIKTVRKSPDKPQIEAYTDLFANSLSRILGE